jgi:hypothetical protein
MTTRERALRRLYVCSLPFVLAAVVSANLVLTTSLRDGHMSIRLHDEGSLTHLARAEQRGTDRRYGFYLELGDATIGQPLRAPESAPFVAWMIQGLSEVELQVSEYDPSALPPEAVPSNEPLGVLETPDGNVPYWILPGDGPGGWAFTKAGS